MSHFSVLVVTKPGINPDDLLQPFHEFECTGISDQYVIDVDKTGEMREKIAAAKKAKPELTDADALAEALDYFGMSDRQVSDESEVDREGEHKFGFAIVQGGNLIQYVYRTNPNKKWDWWVVGGRWDGFLKSNGLTVNEGLASEIDWDGMIASAGVTAGQRYDDLTAAIAGRAWQTWPTFRARADAGEITRDEAREQFWAQPVLVDAKPLLGWFGGDEQLQEVVDLTREAYVDHIGKESARTYALLDADGNWHEPGVMGWFGMSSETPDSKRAFTQKFWEVVRAIPADHTVTVVDCHI